MSRIMFWTDVRRLDASFFRVAVRSSSEGGDGWAINVLAVGGLGKLNLHVVEPFLHDLEWFLECICTLETRSWRSWFSTWRKSTGYVCVYVVYECRIVSVFRICTFECWGIFTPEQAMDMWPSSTLKFSSIEEVLHLSYRMCLRQYHSWNEGKDSVLKHSAGCNWIWIHQMAVFSPIWAFWNFQSLLFTYCFKYFWPSSVGMLGFLIVLPWQIYLWDTSPNMREILLLS